MCICVNKQPYEEELGHKYEQVGGAKEIFSWSDKKLYALLKQYSHKGTTSESTYRVL